MTKREINVDLCRIIATFLIIILHILGPGGILRNLSPDQPIYWFAWLLESCGYCAVNCFALISGYIMVDRNPKPKNIITLWFHALFYSLLITALLFTFLPETRSLRRTLNSIVPILSKQWWYLSSYFALFLFIPILNGGIHQLSQRKLRSFLLLILIVVGFMSCALTVDAFIINKGYSPIWLMVMYLFGAYIKKYNLKEKTTALISGIGYLAAVLLTLLSKAVIYFSTKYIFGTAKYNDVFFSYASITVILSSVFLFLFCLNVKVNALSEKIIRFFAPATLGVYLIHVHPLVFDYILSDSFVFLAHKPVLVMVLYVLVAALVIFVICSVIDLLRIRLFQWINISKLSETLAQKASRLFPEE